MTERTDDTITVTGEAVVPAIPDETRFRITLTAVRPAADEALEDVTARSSRLDDLLTELGIEHKKRSTSGLSLREKRRWLEERTPEGGHRERSVLEGFEATNAIVVRIDDASRSGRLLQRAVEETDASIDGPYWHIGDENPARLEACRKAARDAARRANAYTDELGLRLGPVRAVTESPAWRASGGVLSGGARTIAAQEIGIDANLELGANVTITYGIER